MRSSDELRTCSRLSACAGFFRHIGVPARPSRTPRELPFALALAIPRSRSRPRLPNRPLRRRVPVFKAMLGDTVALDGVGSDPDRATRSVVATPIGANDWAGLWSADAVAGAPPYVVEGDVLVEVSGTVRDRAVYPQSLLRHCQPRSGRSAAQVAGPCRKASESLWNAEA